MRSEYARLLYLLTHPSEEMFEAGMEMLKCSAVVEYASPTAPKDILIAMTEIAIEQAERA